MSMVGGDVAALRHLAATLRARRADIDAARLRVAAAVDSLPWSGPDRERFFEMWVGVHLPRLEALIAELERVAQNAIYHAARQEEASGR